MRYLYFIILCLLCACCAEERPSVSLNESEVFFKETLASISKDATDENIFYIGTEDGVVYAYNSENQHLEKITTGFDRIYKVVKDTLAEDGPVYWVGTRNMGLFRCELKNNSFVVKEKRGRFYIPAKGNESQYSAYDISVLKSGTYVATTHGLFKVPEENDENDSTLIVLGPKSQKLSQENLHPVVVGNLQTFNDKYLFCASDSGLLRIELSSGKLDTFFPLMHISNIVVRNDSIYSLTGGSIVVCDHNGKAIKSYKLKVSALLYYYDETTQTNYFIDDQTIQLVKDSDLSSPDKYKQVPARRAIRTKCHNIIVNDIRHKQSLLVTNHSISRIGHHQDMFNSYGNVKYICEDKGNIYYLIDTKLYRQKDGEDKAYQLKDITKGTKDIRFMEVLDDVLYYIDSNDEMYKAKLYSHYFFNSVLSWDSHIKQDPKKKKEVTAIGKDGNNVYVGVRDGFRNINELGKDIPLYTPSSQATITDPFITRFVRNGNNTLVCTLNDGVFSGKDNYFTRLPGSDSFTFIRDVGVDSTANGIYLLTNHGLYQQKDSFLTATMELSGYNRLLVLDSAHVIGVPNFGIVNLCDSIDYFTDIQFNPAACLVAGNKIIAGSSNGAYVFSSDLPKNDGITESSSTYYTINFDERDYLSRKNIIIAIVIVLVLIIGTWWYDRYRMSRRAIDTLKNGLILRLDELNSVRQHLNAETTMAIDGLVAKVESVDVSTKKKAIDQLREISLEIMQLTSKIPSILTRTLLEQIVRIKKSGLNDAPNYILKTNEAINNHTLLRLGGQISANEQWLSQAHSVMTRLSDYRALFANLPVIVGVTDEIKMVLNSAKSPNEQLIIIEKLAGKIDDTSSREKIKKYLDAKIQECSSAQSDFEVESEFYSTFELIRQDYLNIEGSVDSAGDMAQVMKFIPATDRHLSILLNLRNIRNLLPKYDKSNSDYEHKMKETEKRQREGYYALHDSSRKTDNDEVEQRQKRCTEISAEITKNIDELYIKFAGGSEIKLLKTLEISFRENEGRQFMQANILALLLTGTDIPVSRFKNLFGVNEQSLRRVRRELNKLIESHRQDIIEYAEDVNNRTSIAILLLKLLDSSKLE